MGAAFIQAGVSVSKKRWDRFQMFRAVSNGIFGADSAGLPQNQGGRVLGVSGLG